MRDADVLMSTGFGSDAEFNYLAMGAGDVCL
jgi:hypothetical protein